MSSWDSIPPAQSATIGGSMVTFDSAGVRVLEAPVEAPVAPHVVRGGGVHIEAYKA